MSKKRNMYEVREFIGNNYSKPLGRRLREHTDAMRVVRILKKQRREVFAAAIKVAA